MNNMVYFIDYNKSVSNYKKIFFKIKKERIDESRVLVLLNWVLDSERKLLKLIKYLKKLDAKYIVLSKDLKEVVLILEKNNFYVVSGKILMNKMAVNIINYILECQSKEFALCDVYITANNVNNEEIIFDIATQSKSINIVTTKLKKMRRIEQKLENQENVIYSIANNTKKSLKRAELIVNLDWNGSQFEKFTLNRKAIILNLSNEELHIKGKTQGTIIEDVIIMDLGKEYQNENLTNFTQSSICEAKAIKEKYEWSKAIKTLKIDGLIGQNGIVNIYEFNSNKA